MDFWFLERLDVFEVDVCGRLDALVVGGTFALFSTSEIMRLPLEMLSNKHFKSKYDNSPCAASIPPSTEGNRQGINCVCNHSERDGDIRSLRSNNMRNILRMTLAPHTLRTGLVES